MALRLKVSGANKRDLEAIRDLGPEQLKNILGGISRLGFNPPSLRQIRDAIEKNIPSREEADKIARQFLMLASVARSNEATPKEVISALSISVREIDWTEEDLQKWEEIKEPLEKILEAPSVSYLAKSIDLVADYSNRLKSAKILTEIRPVYSDNKEEIVSALITNILRIRYWNEEGQQSLSIALDSNDIEMLKKHCEEAIEKMRTARSMLQQSCGIKPVAVGEELYELE